MVNSQIIGGASALNRIGFTGEEPKNFKTLIENEK